MKCTATIESIMEAEPCYPRDAIENVFREHEAESFTPREIGNLRRHVVMHENTACTCASCNRMLQARDRMWVLLYVCGLKKATILAFIKGEAWGMIKKWKGAPASLIKYFKTGKGKPAQIKADMEDTDYQPARYVARLYLGKEREDKFWEYLILFKIIGGSSRKQREYLRKLVKLCESQK